MLARRLGKGSGAARRNAGDPSVKNGTLQLVTFYHDGKRVDEAPLSRMAELMGAATRYSAMRLPSRENMENY
jgi:hypothetical protein